MNQRIFLLTTALLCCVFQAFPQTPFKAKSISIFKNGSAFFIKGGQVDTKEGSYKIIENIPQALFGTLWIHSSDSQLKSVSSYMDEVKTPIKSQNIQQLLLGNVGKKVKLYLTEENEVTGTIEDIEGSMVTIKGNDSWFPVMMQEIKRMEFFEKPTAEYEREETKKVVDIEFMSNLNKQNLDMMYLQNGLGWLPNYHVELLEETKALSLIHI